MFQLSEARALLSAVNLRAEMHGEERAPAADLHFKLSMPVAALAQLDPKLPAAFYMRSDEPADLATDPNALTAFKFGTHFDSIPWILAKPATVNATVHFGVSGWQDVVLPDAKLDKIAIEFLQQGVVRVSFKVSGYPTQDEKGRLSEWIQKEMCISVEPVTEAQGDLLDQQNGKGKGDKEKDTPPTAPANVAKPQAQPADGKWPFPGDKKRRPPTSREAKAAAEAAFAGGDGGVQVD